MIYNTLIRSLLENNSVIISGFGTFYVKQMTSQIKEDIIYPPQTLIEFEYQKDIEDFSFVNKLSQWEQIRIDEAQNKITEWVELIEKGLEHNKSLFFDDFGTFSKDASGKIVFQGMLNAKLNVENEGLEPIVLPQRNLHKTDRNSNEPVKDKRIALHKRKKKRDTWLFVLITLAAAGLLCVLLLKDQINDICRTGVTDMNMIDGVENKDNIYISKIAEEEPVVMDNTENSIKPVTSDSMSENIVEESSVNKSTTPISLATFQELYLPYQKGYYYAIAGSFVKEESALLHIKQKKLDKYHAKLIIHPDNPRIRVCIGIFDNEEEAVRTATQLDKNYWVLK